MVFLQFGQVSAKEVVMGTSLLWLRSLKNKQDETTAQKLQSPSLKSESLEGRALLMVSLMRVEMEIHRITFWMHCLTMEAVPADKEGH